MSERRLVNREADGLAWPELTRVIHGVPVNNDDK